MKTSLRPMDPPGPGPVSPEESGGKPFFRRTDWLAFWVVTLLTLGLYFFSLAPTVTLEDSGELVVASDYLGVPHPPGYPIWTLITWAFQWVFHWVRFYGQPDSNALLVWKSLQDLFTPGVSGHPNPAWGVGLASAVFGALACGLLSLLLSRSGRDLLARVRPSQHPDFLRIRSGLCWAAAVSAGLILACSPVLWSQSVIAEVYSLNSFFQILLLLLLYRWARRPREVRTLYTTAFLFGLGLTNHQTLAFMGPMLVVAIALTDLKLFRDFTVAGLGLFAILAVNIWGSMTNQKDLLWSTGPEHPAFWIHTGLALGIPLLAMALLPRGRVVGLTILFFELGLAFYLFMPFAGEQNPPMNWGYPRTWTGFLHALTRGQYDKIAPGDIFSYRFVEQLGLYAKDLRGQFSLPIVLGGFLPFCAWRLNGRNRTFSAFIPALLIALAAVPLIIFEAPLAAAGYAHWAVAARRGYVLLSALVVLAGGVGVVTALVRSGAWIVTKLRAPQMDLATRTLFVLLAGLLLAITAYVDWMILLATLGHPDWHVKLLGLLAVAFPILAFFGVWTLSVRTEQLSLEMPPMAQRWMIMLIVAFFSVSFMFLAVANDSLDIQTQFVIRVQLVQSHAIFAGWLGYGLLLTLTHLNGALAMGKSARTGLALGVLALPGVLLWQNAYDEEQLQILGGSEQNGHNFGWMFGYWSMRGAEAIREELSPAEWAAYPTPGYPAEMEPNAIFFGGTDPGRFVPTYMIYGAHVREDVFLITQNALADITYMNVMRDLYGEQIWIPSSYDNNHAFEIFLQDVQTGRTQAGSDIVSEDGRVSVQGVQGVMQINGILTRMIFDRNKFRHPFYVEESYVIPWMYPFLEPHGLILKLNDEPVQWTDQTVQNDQAFWNWLATRLVHNPRFQRDINARKAFSKLRCAIAGCYAFRGLYPQAEAAFAQAIELYPLSPEAVFRLTDVLLQQHKFDEALERTSGLLRRDPLNERAKDLVNTLAGLREANRRRLEIEAGLNAGPTDTKTVIELARLYRTLQMWNDLDRLARQILSTPGLDPQAYLDLAQLAAEMRQWAIVEPALRIVLQNPAAPIGIWADLLFVEMARGEWTELWQSMDQGIAATRGELRNLLATDPRFQPIRSHPEFLKRVPPPRGFNAREIPEGLQHLLR